MDYLPSDLPLFHEALNVESGFWTMCAVQRSPPNGGSRYNMHMGLYVLCHSAHTRHQFAGMGSTKISFQPNMTQLARMILTGDNLLLKLPSGQSRTIKNLTPDR